MDLARNPLTIFRLGVDEVGVVRREAFLEGTRQCTGDVARHKAGLHKMLLEERDDACMTGRIKSCRRQQRSGRVKRGVVVPVDGTWPGFLLRKEVPLSERRASAHDPMSCQRSAFGGHSTTPSLSTLFTNDVVRQTGSRNDAAVTTRGEMYRS